MRTPFSGVHRRRRPFSLHKSRPPNHRLSNGVRRVELLEGRFMLDGLSWTSGPALPVALGNVEAINTFVGVLVAGGTTSAAGTTTPRGAYLLDPTDPTATSWSTDLSIDRGRNAGGIGATGSFGPVGSDGSKYLSDVMLFGGASAGTPTSSMFNYNLYNVSDTGDAGTPPSMSTARYKFAYATDPAIGDLYAIGGLNGSNQRLASVEGYDPAADAWGSVAALPKALSGASAASDGAGHILVFGGIDSAGTPVNTVYRYTIATDSWDTAAAMPIAASGTAAVFGAYGQIYVIGGLAASGPLASVNIYNPVTDQWTSDASLPAAEYGAAAVMDSAGNLDVIGGFDAAGNAVATVYQSAALPAPVGLPAVPTVQLFADALYDGAPQSASAVAVASDGFTQVDGTFTFTYNGSATPPTNAGAYNLVASFTSSDPNYVNTIETDIFYIDPATPTLAVSGGGTIAYDGLPHPISAAVVGVDGVTPVSGTLNIAYNGSASAPVNPGTYTAVATFTSADSNYTGASASTTIIIPDPTIPISVTVSGASTSSVRVSWNAVQGAAYYNVYKRHVQHSPRGSLETITYPLVAGGVTSTSVVIGVTSGTFRVTSVSTSGVESPPSILASGSALSAPYLANFLLGGAVMSSASVQVGQTLQFTLLGYGNEAPTYALINGPATMSVDAAMGVVTYSPVAGEVGTVFATFTATNSVGASTATFSFQVGPSLMQGDWNQDGKLDVSDLGAMLNGLSDLTAYQQATGLSGAQLPTVGDANADGQANNLDVQALLNQLANASSGATAAATLQSAAPALSAKYVVAPDVSAPLVPSATVLLAAATTTVPVQIDVLAVPPSSSPLSRLVINSMSNTISTVDLRAEFHATNATAAGTPAGDARPTLAPSAVDDIMSASQWHTVSRHPRKLDSPGNSHPPLDETIDADLAGVII